MDCARSAREQRYAVATLVKTNAVLPAPVFAFMAAIRQWLSG
jgi:hypothetical protein